MSDRNILDSRLRSRRQFLGTSAKVGGSVLGGLALADFLAACGTSAPTVQAKAFPTGPITISFWNGTEDTENNYLKNIVMPKYKTLHPNVTIEYSILDSSDMETKTTVAVATHTTPTILDLSGTQLAFFEQKNVLAPAEDQDFPNGVAGLLNTYLPHTLDQQQYSGKLYALPYQENSFSLYMNNRAFQAAGLDPIKDAPKTWPDVARLQPLLTKKDSAGRVVQKGFDWRYTAGDHWFEWPFEGLVFQTGGKMLDASGQPLFNDAHGVQALQVFKSVGSAFPTVSHNDSSNPYQDFASEQDAMAWGGPNMGALVELTNPKMVGAWTAAPMPQIDPAHPANLSYSFDFAVSKDATADAQRVGWDFVAFALSDSAAFFAASRQLQPHVGWYNTASAKKTPYLDVFIHDLAISTPLTRTIYAAQMQSAIAKAIQRVTLNGQDIKASLDQAAQEYKQQIGP